MNLSRTTAVIVPVLLLTSGGWFFREPLLDRLPLDSAGDIAPVAHERQEIAQAPTVETEAPETNGEKTREETPKESGDTQVSTQHLFAIFSKATVKPKVFLDGHGENIDSPEVFEASNPMATLLFVSGKGNDIVEVWKYPFEGNEQTPLRRPSLPNGLAVDQKRDWLIIGDSEEREAAIYSLPGLSHVKDIGRDKLGDGEANADVLTREGGDIIYVTESHRIRGYHPDTGNEVVRFSPDVESIEEVLVDDFHETIYVPDENGGKSKLHAGGAIAAYTPTGAKKPKNGTHLLGRGVYSGDGEGATLYRCLNEEGRDTGKGWLIFADQDGEGTNGFEFFNRETWKHLGTLTLEGVSFTDGIVSTELSSPLYPKGFLAVSNNDRSTALAGWDTIMETTKLTCPT